MNCSPRRVAFASVKRSLLAGVALASLCAGTAAAQTAPIATAPVGARPPAPAASDGLAPGAIYIEADQVTRQDEAQKTIASGDVEARYDGRNLRADSLTYDQGQGLVEAQNVQIHNPDGSVEFAREIVMDDDMQTGVARGFAARLP